MFDTTQPGQLLKINPMDFVHGRGDGKNRLGSRPLRSRDPSREKAAGRRPATSWGHKAPDPMSWHELLLALKQPGLERGPELAVGDGALGFWKALREVMARPENNAAGCIKPPMC